MPTHIPPFVIDRAVEPYPPQPLHLDGSDRVMADVAAVETTRISGTEVFYFSLQEHAEGTRDALYGEPTERTFLAPMRMMAHVDMPDAMPEVREEGYRATWSFSIWIARAEWEAAAETTPTGGPSEGDVVGLWNSPFFEDNEAQQGEVIPGARFFFTVTAVSATGPLFGSEVFVGFQMTVQRNTNFAPERRIEATR